MSEHRAGCPNLVSVDKLVPGKRYRIYLKDCCIEGIATAFFIKYVDKEYGELLFDSIEFVNSHGVKFEEI